MQIVTAYEKRRYTKVLFIKSLLPVAFACFMAGVVYVVVSLLEQTFPFLNTFFAAEVIAGFFALIAIGSELINDLRLGFGGWFQRTAVTMIIITGVVSSLLPILLWQVYQLV